MTSDTPLQPEHEQPHGGFASVSVAAILAESAERHADRVAVVVGDVSTTYRELWDETRAYAGALRDRGVGEGTRVAMLIPNVADFPRVYYAVLALGGVVVPVHALLKSEEIAYVLRDSGSALLVCAGPLLEQGAKGAALADVPVISVLSCRPPPREGPTGSRSSRRPRRPSAPTCRVGRRTPRRSSTPPAPPASRRARRAATSRS